MGEHERTDDRATQQHEASREAERALTARERLNRELDALEESLRAMKRAASDRPAGRGPRQRAPHEHGGAG
jgi:hypothetical protein